MDEPRSLQYIGPRVWVMSPYPIYHGAKLKLNWGAFLPPETGTRHQREYLLGSARQFLMAWIKMREQQRDRLSPMTIIQFFARLRTLVRWMVENNIWRFNLIAESDVQDYLIKIAGTRVSLRGQKFSSISRRHLEASIFLLRSLWSLRAEYYASFSIDIENIDIDPILAMTRKNVRWKPVDIEIAVMLLKRALDWCELWEEINALRREMESRHPKWVGEPIWRRRRQFWHLFREMVHDGKFSRVSAALSDGSDLGPAGYMAAVRNATGAALLIVLFFTGMRISEALSLKSNCINQRIHSDGENHYYVRGYACKKNGKERLWVVPDVVVKVLRNLIDFNLPLEKRFGCLPIFLHRRTVSGEAITAPARISPGMANDLMRCFLREQCGESGKMLAGVFHAHRARKTFARFIALRNKSALEALAYHYGHLYAALLDQQYVGTDFDLFELVREEGVQEIRNGLTEMLQSTKLGGKAGVRLSELRSQEDVSVFGGKTSLDSFVNRLIKSGIVLAPCDWGYCVYAPDLSKCNGTSVAPSEERRSPAICASCANFAVSDRHLSWWSDRYKEQDEFLRRDDLIPQARRVAEWRFKTTRYILGSIVSFKSGRKDE